MERVLNASAINKRTANVKDLKVALRRIRGKGYGIIATKPIKKGNTIAFYRLLVHDEDTYRSPTDGVYSVAIYDKDDVATDDLIGDIYEGSIPQPFRNIPYWGHFANEPSGRQRVNAVLDTSNKKNFSRRSILVPGNIVDYKLVATKNIKPLQEITWYYGKNYPRSYKVNAPRKK